MATTIIEQTIYSLQMALYSLGNSFLDVFPGIIAAIVIVLIGGLVGYVFGKILTRVLVEARVDDWLKRHGLAKALEGLELSKTLGSVLKWYIIIVFLGEAASMIRLAALQTFVMQIVNYVPLLIGAFIVILLGLIIGEYAKNAIVTKMKVKYEQYLGKAAKFIIVYFSVVIGLQTAGFDVTILIDAFRIGFSALIVVVAVVLAVTFALSFRKEAEKFWKGLLK